MSKTYSKTRILVECALMIAIGTVLSNIKFFTMPNGGSITLLSMLPFVLVSFRHGAKWGLFTGFVNACLQMIMGFYPPPASTFLYFLGEVLLDYVLAFMALGLAELFARPFKNRTVALWAAIYSPSCTARCSGSAFISRLPAFQLCNGITYALPGRNMSAGLTFCPPARILWADIKTGAP